MTKRAETATSPKPTIRTVAADAGVSVAAVSKVMRNAYGVSDAMREKVMKSIDKLGYRPSTSARGMRGKTYSIGILLVEMTNPFLPEVVAGITDVLTPAGYKSMIGVGNAEIQMETGLIDSMIDVKMDGVILIAPRLSSALISQYARQLPMVVIGHHRDDETAEAFDTVNCNDVLGGRIAAQALIDKGYRRIEMISLPHYTTDLEVYIAREQGFREAIEAAGMQVRITQMGETYTGPNSPIEAFLNRDDLPDAVFCWSDLHALALINAAKTRGLRVPEDIAIIGFDNCPAAGMPLIELASVDQNGRQLGALAAQTILSRLDGRTTAEHILLDPELVERNSF